MPMFAQSARRSPTRSQAPDAAGVAKRLKTDVAGALSVFRKEMAEFRQDFQEGALRFHRVLTAARTAEIHGSTQAAVPNLRKLAAVGRHAAGIAHDLNNMLTAILGYADVALAVLAPTDDIYQAISEIRKAGIWSQALTRQVLTFVRTDARVRQPMKVNSLLRDMERSLRLLIGCGIELRIVLDPDLGLVLADSAQIERVVLNLLLNARDAMAKGGRLTVVTENVDIKASDPRRRTEPKSGRYVMIAVSDTGVGMNSATQSHLFEPFSSTKDLDHGTGLGLWIVLEIVKESGGAISVTSSPGRGTRVEVYLPRSDGTAEVPAPGRGPCEARGGSETILVVEDEQAVRKLLRQTLESHGYTLLDAACGNEAARVCEKHSGPIDLAVVDDGLPDMKGSDLVRHLRLTRPDLRALRISGLPREDRDSDPGHPLDFSLGKPFTQDAISNKVREVLDMPQGREVPRAGSGPAGATGGRKRAGIR